MQCSSLTFKQNNSYFISRRECARKSVRARDLTPRVSTQEKREGGRERGRAEEEELFAVRTEHSFQQRLPDLMETFAISFRISLSMK